MVCRIYMTVGEVKTMIFFGKNYSFFSFFIIIFIVKIFVWLILLFIFRRLKSKDIPICRFSPEVSRYTMLKHKQATPRYRIFFLSYSINEKYIICRILLIYYNLNYMLYLNLNDLWMILYSKFTFSYIFNSFMKWSFVI